MKTFITTIRNKDITGSTVDWINYGTISTQDGNIWCFGLNEITEDKECEIVWRIDDKYTLVQDLTVKTNQRDYSSEYMTFEAVEDGAYLKFDNRNPYPHAYFKINDGEWFYESSSNSQIIIIADNLKKGDKIYVKSNLHFWINQGRDDDVFSIGGLKVYGNIMSLVYGDDFIGKTTIYDRNFQNLFAHTGLTSAKNLILPATTIKLNAYDGMFKGCTLLTAAPELPATTLEGYCYKEMFYNCTSLTKAPVLPATTVPSWGYYCMFKDCSSLNYFKSYATDENAYGVDHCLENVSDSGEFYGKRGGPIQAPNGWTINYI